MDVCDYSTTDYFPIDDLLDFSNDDGLSSSSSSDHHHHHHHKLPPADIPSVHNFPSINPLISTVNFTDHLCVPVCLTSDDVAELEWLSQFVDDSFNDFPPNPLAATINVRSDSSFASGTRSKRLATTDAAAATWAKSKPKKETKRAPSPTAEGGVRRCTHCASEKTPQWRTGPQGPKTLCNACGVRFKSGRLVPEYRPAASPTFVLTQHSNSHRKVMELRRQKEMLRQQRQEESQRVYHHQNFHVC
ncbi:hypothetical protein K2173_013458 [Erythroxylum novogranatense]|uniref:GATA transcription factor n=1 Tax=Erythroxylum novogranatense TaxID=1862640 RepID=A0AAV8SAF8_9ROSI|nr:hypothetical protein K2173_013458 [Erythroxylum novogranatense]